MDLIKLSSVTANSAELSVGEAITGYTKALWVERYREPGEFKIEAPLSSGLREFLPFNAFVTHLGTSVVMIVENHEIEQDKNKDPTIVITGRCFTSFLERKTVGDQVAYLTNEISDYVLASDETWDQVVHLIDQHMITSANVNDRVAGVGVNNTASGSVTIEERILRPTDVHRAVLDILKVDDLGLKSVRPTSTEPLTYFTVYRGNDVSTKVRFSWMRGDLKNIKYFFSNKKMYNQARIMGRFVQAMINPTGTTGLNRRTMIVDASWIDERQPAYPSNPALGLIVAAMQITGDQQLKKQNNVSITQADVDESTNYIYRKDYNIGDLVTVQGDFGSSAVMRVVEFAEADDETGSSGHPTLAIPGED